VFVTDGVRNPIDTSLQILPILDVAKPNELKECAVEQKDGGLI
jgi:hypothetical protein